MHPWNSLFISLSHQGDWQTTYYGTNYFNLARLRAQYDPLDAFGKHLTPGQNFLTPKPSIVNGKVGNTPGRGKGGYFPNSLQSKTAYEDSAEGPQPASGSSATKASLAFSWALWVIYQWTSQWGWFLFFSLGLGVSTVRFSIVVVMWRSRVALGRCLVLLTDVTLIDLASAACEDNLWLFLHSNHPLHRREWDLSGGGKHRRT